VESKEINMIEVNVSRRVAIFADTKGIKIDYLAANVNGRLKI
jgi:hypothetical protein